MSLELLDNEIVTLKEEIASSANPHGNKIITTADIDELARQEAQLQVLEADKVRIAQLKSMNINELIESRAEVKDAIEGLNRKLKELNKSKDDLDYQLLTQLDKQGLSRTANDKASVSINEAIVPDVKDWDALYAHITKTQDFALLQRRVSSTAYKELLKLDESVPGVETREIRRINFRSL